MLRTKITIIMVISGILTCSMALAIVFPQSTMQRLFGETLEGALAEVLIRSWGVLVTLTGGMLIYAAFHVIHRTFVLSIAIVSKTALLILIAGPGRELLAAAAPIVALDGLMVIIFCLYLLLERFSTHDVRT